MEAEKKYRPSFSIGKEYDDLLWAIARKTRRSKTEELRVMIEERAKKVGLDVDTILSAPKTSALAASPN